MSAFLTEIGFDPVLFEAGAVPYRPGRPLDDSCYVEVDNADLMVLIIGGRYGSLASNQQQTAHYETEHHRSVTKGEYERALAKNVPVYVLVDRSVFGEYQTYKKNRGNRSIKYAQVDSVEVFDFIEDIELGGNHMPIQPFDGAAELISWLRNQWAGLFRELLRSDALERTQSETAAHLADVKTSTESNRNYLEKILEAVRPYDAEEVIDRESERERSASLQYRTNRTRATSLHLELMGALERNEFEVHYQPIVDLNSIQIVGAEALIRWDHPTRGLLGPAEFIPLAETMGITTQLGQFLLERSLNDLANWRDSFGEPADHLTIWLNASPKQFLDPNFGQSVAHALNRANIHESSLVIEIPESTFVEDTDHIRSAFASLRQLEVGLAIDDFGTGYTPISLIADLGVDAIKFDRSLISTDSDRALNVAMRFAEELGAQSVAEAVETAEQLDMLRSIGCERGQGYYFSRPLRDTAFAQLLSHGGGMKS